MNKFKCKFIMALIFITIVSYLNILFSFQISLLVDSIIAKDLNGFKSNIMIFAVIIVGILLFDFLSQISKSSYLNDVGERYHKKLISFWLDGQLETHFYNCSRGLSAINNDIEMLKTSYYAGYLSLFQGLISFIFAFLMLSYLSWTLTIIIVITSAVSVLIPLLFQTKLRNQQNAVSKQLSDYNILLNDFLENLLVLRNLRKKHIFKNEIIQSYRQTSIKRFSLSFWSVVCNVLVGLFLYSTSFVILLFGGWKVLKGELSIGALTSLYAISFELTDPLYLIAGALTGIRSMKDIKEKLDLGPVVQKTSKELSSVQTIKVENITLSIDSTRLFNNFSYVFQFGKKI